jgi:uncharacterized protein YjbI with pentapeptide repeats
MRDVATSLAPQRRSWKTGLAALSLAVASLLGISLLTATVVVVAGGAAQAGASTPVRQKHGSDCWLYFGGATPQRHSECPGTDFTDFSFQSEIDLSYGNFERANFTHSDSSPNMGVIRQANMNGANLSNSSWSGVRFSGTHFVGANLTSADLLNAKLTSVDLSDANLTGADLRGTDVSSVKWSNTTCPDGSNSNTQNNTCVGHLGRLTHIEIGYSGTCDGVFAEGNFGCSGEFQGGPEPATDWPYAGDRHGTVTWQMHAGGSMTINFFVPGAEIVGTIPSENSTRYTVAHGELSPKITISSPPGADTKREGDKGGPLLIVIARSHARLDYSFHLTGWIMTSVS